MRLIGEILLEISELDQASLEKGLALQQEKGGRIGEILLNQKAIQEVDLARALSRQLDLEFALLPPHNSCEQGRRTFRQRIFPEFWQ